MSVTWILILSTVLISYSALKQASVQVKFWFNAYSVWHFKEWYRMVTHGFLHADYLHLAFNMFSLYMFGPRVENEFKGLFGNLKGVILYLILYFGGIVLSSVYSLFKHRGNPHYNALGASGAVCSVIYSSILFFPLETLYVWGIPVKAWLYALLFLGGSWYMSKKQYDTIGHDAHFFGALWGLAFPCVVYPEILSYVHSLFFNA
jgi:membrane associated rhomboid family serine protease